MKKFILAVAVSLFVIGSASACPKHLLSKSAVKVLKAGKHLGRLAAHEAFKVGKIVF